MLAACCLLFVACRLLQANQQQLRGLLQEILPPDDPDGPTAGGSRGEGAADCRVPV